MFTKSGSKLVRISIPEKKDPPSNGDTKQNNIVNGHINSILDELVSTGWTVTAINPETPTAQEKNSITPTSNIKKLVKTGTKPDSISKILPAKNNFIPPNVVPGQKITTKRIKLCKNKGQTISSVRSKTANNQTPTDQPAKQVFTAFKAKDIFTAAPTDIKPQNLKFHDNLPLAGPSTAGQPLSVRRIINGTEYVPFTPQSNVVKRERLIQVNEFDIQPIQESAVQCDLIEDDSSSESSQSDWINEIIEEYEFLEESQMYECQICGEVCPNHLYNLKHAMTHKESSLLCFRCGRLFPNTSKLLEHEDKTHAEDKFKIKKALRCPKLNCLKAFHSKRQLFNHIDQHGTRLTEQRCSKCQRSFASPLQLLCHINRRNCWR